MADRRRRPIPPQVRARLERDALEIMAGRSRPNSLPDAQARRALRALGDALRERATQGGQDAPF